MSFPFGGSSSGADLAPHVASGYACPRCGRHFVDWLARCPSDGAALIVSVPPGQDDDPMVGRDLDGRYTILARIGSGSMGTVYRARQNAMMRDVAIKILRSDKALDETSKARFLRESRATSALTSPNTVTVFDFGETHSGELFLAMELLDGESLGQRLTRLGRMSPLAAVDTARQALRSLAEAHAKGIVHRDLKPDNVFFARVRHVDHHEEIVKVLDFGIAKLLGESAGPLNAVETQAGTVFGTPRYMSPEQAQSKPLDGRTDLYSLGVLLYHMLTGSPPFTDDDAIIVMARHIRTPPRPFTEVAPDAAIPPDLERVVLRCLAKDPQERPATADVLSLELARAVDPARAAASGVRPSIGSGASVVVPNDFPSRLSLASSPDRGGASVVTQSAPAVPPPRWPLVVLGCAIIIALSAVAALVRDRSVRASVAGTPPMTGAATTAARGAPPAIAVRAREPAAPASAVSAAPAPTPIVDDALEPTSLPLVKEPAPRAPDKPDRSSARPNRPRPPPRSAANAGAAGDADGTPAQPGTPATAATAATAPATSATGKYGILD